MQHMKNKSLDTQIQASQQLIALYCGSRSGSHPIYTEKAIALAPKHADARIALGAFHAEVIDKVGSLIGGMTYGAKKDTGLKLFQEALKLNPGSAIAMIEYANALVMLDGDKKMKEATALYEQAAACTPLDAMERLDVEMAQAELEE